MIPERIPGRTVLAGVIFLQRRLRPSGSRILAQMQAATRTIGTTCEFLLLAQRHARVKRGSARGGEPVKFVEQGRGFLAVLEWKDPASDAGASDAPALEKPAQ
jgi:hypothetical protein